MDKLKEIIETLNPDDKKEFRVFINRQKNKRDRKDLDLFNLLDRNANPKATAIIPQLYPTGNSQAYHALRKRLLRHLMDFIVLKRLDEDTSAASSIMGHLSLASHLFEKNAPRLAWLYLRKAEKMAEETEQFALLNTIYNRAIEQAASEYADPLATIIAKRNTNKERADEDERANIANSLIQKQLSDVRLQGKDLDFDRINRQVLQEYGLSEAVIKRPALLYRILSISRSAILAKKDFFTFEPYIIDQYQRMAETTGFTRHTHYYKISLLYMIAHVLYRNKKFNQSLEYLEYLHPNLLAYNRAHFARFYPRFQLLSAANRSYLGENGEAIIILEKTLATKEVRLEVKDQLNMTINLAVYYAQQEDYRKANRTLLQIHHTDKWCEKKMGREWVLRKNLIEVIIQYELDNIDIADNRIRSIERTFKSLFNNPVYARVRTFLSLIREIMNNPDQVASETFYDKVKASFEFISGAREDLLAMSFYAWIKSKIVKEPYYPVLLDIIRNLDEEPEPITS